MQQQYTIREATETDVEPIIRMHARKYVFSEIEGSARLYDVIPVAKMIRKGDEQ